MLCKIPGSYWVYLRLAAPPRQSCGAMVPGIHETHSIPTEDQRQSYKASISRMNGFGLYWSCKCFQKSIDSVVLRKRDVVVDTAEYYNTIYTNSFQDT